MQNATLRLLGLALFAVVLLLIPGGARSAVAHAKPASGGVRGHLAAPPGRAKTKLQFRIDGNTHKAATNRQGFLIKGIPVGSHTLSVSDSGGKVGAYASFTVTAKTVTDLGTLTLQSGGQIAGIVSQIVDVNTGDLKPLPGVQVIAETDFTPPILTATGKLIPVDPPPVPQVRLTTTTDANGSYLFPGVQAGFYRVSVAVPGLEAGVEFVDVEPGSTASADFQLRESIPDGVGTVNGTVTGADGGPLEGALVTVYSDGYFYPGALSPESIAHARTRGVPNTAIIAIPRGVFSTLTDAAGHYSLNLPTGYLSLTASADGLQPVQLPLILHPEETLTEDVTLDQVLPPPGGTVAGSVYNAKTGGTVSGATVTIFVPSPIVDPPGSLAPSGGGGRPIPAPQQFTATTDDKGFYEIDGVPAGSWKAVVNADGFNAQSVTANVDDGGYTELDVKLLPGGKTGKGR